MKFVYEFIGTFFLVFTVGMSALNPYSAGMLAPIAIATVLAVMIYAGGHVSGAHYNPAVSLAAFIRGRLSAKDLVIYWIFQFIAAIIAAVLTLYLKGVAPEPVLEFETVKAFIGEFLFTFALCFVFLNVATAKKTLNNSFFGFAIGFTVLAGAYTVGPISGGAFNPAVAVGITAMNVSPWSNLWIFFSANLLGSIGAALIFKLAHQEE